jgi:hypothetical protein
MPAASASMSSRPAAISRSSLIDSARLRFSAAYLMAVPCRVTDRSWSLVDMPRCIETDSIMLERMRLQRASRSRRSSTSKCRQ